MARHTPDTEPRTFTDEDTDLALSDYRTDTGDVVPFYIAAYACATAPVQTVINIPPMSMTELELLHRLDKVAR